MKDDKCKAYLEANGADFIEARTCTSLGSYHVHNLNHAALRKQSEMLNWFDAEDRRSEKEPSAHRLCLSHPTT